MLNAKYVVLTRTDEPMINPHANGNVWFVNQVAKVNSANEELLGLGKINTKNQAIVDVSHANIPVSATYAIA